MENLSSNFKAGQSKYSINCFRFRSNCLLLFRQPAVIKEVKGRAVLVQSGSSQRAKNYLKGLNKNGMTEKVTVCQVANHKHKLTGN
jgi:hypothetical protein